MGDGLARDDRAAFTRALVAPVIEASGPLWQPPEYDPAKSYGLLIISGLLGRRVKVGSAVATELVGVGDIVRPWDEPVLWGMAGPELDWRIFRPARLAVLDEVVTSLIGRRPQLVINLSSRLLRRLRSVAYLTAISHQLLVEEKLLATLWHLASNWGKVTPTGIRIPFCVTHEVLREMMGAQRPSVTMALRRLTARGLVCRAPDRTYVLATNTVSPSESHEDHGDAWFRRIPIG